MSIPAYGLDTVAQVAKGLADIREALYPCTSDSTRKVFDKMLLSFWEQFYKWYEEKESL